jgi:hypothetical protein
MRKRGIDYPKELSAVRYFVWLGPQQAVILPEFHAIPLAALESIVDCAVTTDRAGVTGWLSAIVRRHFGPRRFNKDNSAKPNQARRIKQDKSGGAIQRGCNRHESIGRTPARCSIM